MGQGTTFGGYQPFLEEQDVNITGYKYDDSRNDQEIGRGLVLYNITDILPGGPVSIDISPTSVNPVIQFLDGIRKILPIWVWVFIGFLLMYFKRSRK